MIKKGKFYLPEPVGGGRYRLIYGGVLKNLRLFDDESIDLIVTSPPYLWQVDYGLEGQYGWEENSDEYIDNQKRVAIHMHRALKPSGNIFFVIKDSYNKSGGLGGDGRRTDGTMKRKYRKPGEDLDTPGRVPLRIPDRIAEAFSQVGLWRKHRIIWDQKATFRGGSRRLSNSYEEIHHYVKDLDQYYFNNEAVLREGSSKSKGQLDKPYKGKGQIDYSKIGREDPSDKKRRAIESMKKRDGKCLLLDIWDIPTGKNPEVEFADGSVVRGKASFPLLLAQICVLLGSRPGNVVLDPYCGMGTTLLAATMYGRDAIGIDLNKLELRAVAIRLEREHATQSERIGRSEEA